MQIRVASTDELSTENNVGISLREMLRSRSERTTFEGQPWTAEPGRPAGGSLVAEADDPFDDFEEDDFDDDFDDDFEEDWEDDLTEDDEFPDTFGGAEEAEEAGDESSPFSDDPDFDDD